jgi:hypothetical protein
VSDTLVGSQHVNGAMTGRRSMQVLSNALPS